MDGPSIHPSQRRLSCEVCRRHKSKCQRIDKNDPKCSRCTILRVECITGQQKRVGRPRQTATASRHNGSGALNSNTRNSSLRRSRDDATDRWHRLDQPSLLGNDLEDIVAKGLGTSTSSMISTAPAPTLATRADDAIQAWPEIEMDSSYQESSIWNTSEDGYRDFTLSNLVDSNSSLAVPNAHWAGRPATIVPHDAALRTVSSEQDIAGGGIDTSESISILSKINVNLHVRIAAIERNKATLDMNSFLYVESPLFIDNSTLTVFTLKTTHDFLQVLTRLLNNRLSHRRHTSQELQAAVPDPLSLPLQSYKTTHEVQLSTSSFSYPSATSQPSVAPLALAITSIFTQLISLYEVSLEHLNTRIERISIDPIAPIPGLTFAGLPLIDPCMQGMLFTNMIVSMLDRIELALGVGKTPEHSNLGLLSSRQIDVLWSELNGRPDVFLGHGASRLALVRKRFEKVSKTLTHLSLGGGR